MPFAQFAVAAAAVVVVVVVVVSWLCSPVLSSTSIFLSCSIQLNRSIPSELTAICIGSKLLSSADSSDPLPDFNDQSMVNQSNWLVSMLTKSTTPETGSSNGGTTC